MNQYVQWDLPFWMWKSTFMSWSFMSVLTSASVSDDSFIASAETKGLDWKTHELSKCSWGELPSGFHHCHFSLVQNSKEFLRGFSGLCVQITQVRFLALCFQQSLLLGFSGISTLSSMESWRVVKEFGKETCVFRQHFCFVMVKLIRSEWWFWVRYWK